MARALAAVLCFAFAALAIVAARADQQEAKAGAQIYDWLRSKNIIIDQSPLYDTLNAIANPIKTVADPLYDAPFTFTIGRDRVANVASVPGGRVYVSDKAFEFLKYREELAGALCHAVSHTVRHDYASILRKNINAYAAGSVLGGALLAGAWYNNPFAFALRLASGNMSDASGAGAAASTLYTAATLNAIATAERAADIQGADLCAQAGINPWGMVWLLQNYGKSQTGGKMEMLSDFPADRVRNLKAHFESAPDRFAKFDPDRARGTPLRP
jgi:predicted Zn-dependent protease